MVVGSHEKFSTGSFKLSRERSDASCLSFSSSPIGEDDEATDIKPELLLTKHRQKKVTFYDRVVVVPIHQYLSSEEKSTLFMSGEELLAIRYALRALVIQTENDRLTSSNTPGLEENDENLRGLEIYVYPGKFESASRKERAFQAVFESQQKCYDEEKVATEYARISVEASERALKLGLIDQERAWSFDELELLNRAPRNLTMDR